MEKEKKVYEVPAMQVHQMMAPALPLCKSGSGPGGTIVIPDESRGLGLDDEEE